MNSESKGYISVKYDILTFFEHFDRSVADKRHEEVKCDFKATQSTPKLESDLRILRHATNICTPAVFFFFFANYTPAVFKVLEEQR
jgi:zinc finger SWIM domain-containing protein 3